MRPGQIDAGELFSSGTKQYWVPRYQRRYDWPADKLHGLWRDIGSLYTGANKGSHFLGIILGNPENMAGGVPTQRIEIIDGHGLVGIQGLTAKGALILNKAPDRVTWIKVIGPIIEAGDEISLKAIEESKWYRRAWAFIKVLIPFLRP